MVKKISVAFVWHMHQPKYNIDKGSGFLMPWVRLHAVKDYLDMLMLLEKFPKIKQTFNIVPVLLDQLEIYGENNGNDIHSSLTLKSVEELTDENKIFILEHFFDANYSTMIIHHERYNALYQKRFANENITINDFSLQDYSDIMALFNIAWIDPYWNKVYPELKALVEKDGNYTLEDRVNIIEIQRKIIRQIVPKYKEFLEKGQIEITTSPYYHPILPLLLDIKSAKRAIHNIQLPNHGINFGDDAKAQLLMSIEKIEKTFGQKPKGIWPSENCISPETIDLFKELGIKWTISDEGVLAKSIDKEFVRDFRGYTENPYDLCKSYTHHNAKGDIDIVFRDAVLANLIGFEYGKHDSFKAANDLYERIKTTQSKLASSPDEHHLITIALDGENCWESYPQDGYSFLKALYTLLSEDKTIETITVSEYLEKATKKIPLKKVYSGSWINRNFQVWIGEPTKNLAWEYLYKTRQDLCNFIKEEQYSEKILQKVWNEIYIAEGSDWFWWYGEPNDSGQDELFDMLFRTHLQNVYTLLKKPIPPYLDLPLEAYLGKPSKTPLGLIHPIINGLKIPEEDNWTNAGCIEIYNSPMFESEKLFERVLFGNDENNMYFRFDINKFRLEELKKNLNLKRIGIYFQNFNETKPMSAIRGVLKSDKMFPIAQYPFSYEVSISLYQNNLLPIQLSEAIEGYLWQINMNHKINYAYKDFLEVSIPFDDLNVKPGEEVSFLILLTTLSVVEDILPQDMVLTLRRPAVK